MKWRQMEFGGLTGFVRGESTVGSIHSWICRGPVGLVPRSHAARPAATGGPH